MGIITLEHKFNIGDNVNVIRGHILFADSDPMGDPGVDINGSKGIVDRIDFSHFISYDDRNKRQVSRTEIIYNVNFSGISSAIPEDSLSHYTDQ